MEKIDIIYEDGESRRLDVCVSMAANITRSYAVKLIESGCVQINDSPANKKTKVKQGDSLSISIPDPENITVEAQDIPLDIAYEDDDLLVINKPKGMVVHPAAGNFDGTLVNAVLHHCKGSLSGINGVLRPGIVHRIDKNTSGLLLIAKNDVAHNSLALQLRDHSLTREYEAIVYGNIKNDSGRIETLIGRHPTKRKQMAVNVQNGKNAVTNYTVLERFGNFTYVRLRLETGRTHQIRVHMASLGHPVAGDDVYGPKKVITKLSGQCLHARKIGFIHPKTNEYLEFCSELPQYFSDFLEECRKNGVV